MKVERVCFAVSAGEGRTDAVTGVLKVPSEFKKRQSPAVILAHGAGGGFDDPALSYVQSFLVGRGFVTLCFNFPYREKERKVPDRERVLEATIRSAIRFLGEHPRYAPGQLFIGGKSMGGRMASNLLAADSTLASGLILLAYPLHAPGRPDRVRDQHLSSIAVPTLFVSGTRDALAPVPSLNAALARVSQAQIVWVDGADHSFNMLRKSGKTAEDVWNDLAVAVAGWLETVRNDPIRQHPPEPGEGDWERIPAGETAFSVDPSEIDRLG